MEETKITASLPNLDVEMTRHASPDGNAETVTLRMTAVPSFEAVGDHLMKPGGFPFLPPGPMLMMSLWSNPWANPFLAWTRMAQSAWQPLLDAAAPQVADRHGDKGGGRDE